MRRGKAIILFVGLFVFTMVTNGAAMPSKEEKNLDREIARLDRTASTADGERAVIKRIESDFKVSAAQVGSLRDRNLGYGEIIVVYSLARTMSGGITDATVEQVLVVRQGPPVKGWGQVAAQLNKKLGRSVSQVKKVNNEAHRFLKQATAKPSSGPKEPSEAVPPRKEQRREYPGEGKPLPQGRAAD
jgi:hypothetical protein